MVEDLNKNLENKFSKNDIEALKRLKDGNIDTLVKLGEDGEIGKDDLIKAWKMITSGELHTLIIKNDKGETEAKILTDEEKKEIKENTGKLFRDMLTNGIFISNKEEYDLLCSFVDSDPSIKMEISKGDIKLGNYALDDEGKLEPGLHILKNVSTSNSIRVKKTSSGIKESEIIVGLSAVIGGLCSGGVVLALFGGWVTKVGISNFLQEDYFAGNKQAMKDFEKFQNTIKKIKSKK